MKPYHSRRTDLPDENSRIKIGTSANPEWSMPLKKFWDYGLIAMYSTLEFINLD